MPAHFLYAATVAIWGSSWLAMTYQLGVVPPEQSIVYRFLLAAAILWGYCLATRRRLRFRGRDHAFMAAQGFFLFAFNYQLFYLAAGMLTSGLLAVAFSTMLLMNIVNGALLFRHAVDRRVLLAGAFGLGGLALLFWPEIAGLEFSRRAALGLALSLLATYSASLGNMVSVRHKAAGIPVVESNTLGMSYGALFSLLLALITGQPLAFDLSPAYVGSLLYLALFASVFGFGCYLTLVQRIGADRAAYATVLFPLVALGLSTLFEGYRWTVVGAAGVVLVLSGNLLVLVAGRARRPLPPLQLIEREVPPS